MNDLVLTLRETIRDVLTENLVLIISVAVIFAALFAVWLLMRGIRLWYWKVNERAGVLKNIDKRLKQVEKYMAWEVRKIETVRPFIPAVRDIAEDSAREPEPAGQAEAADHDAAAAEPEDAAASGVREEAREQVPEDAQEETRPIQPERPCEASCRGRSGRIYVREELEASIQD